MKRNKIIAIFVFCATILMIIEIINYHYPKISIQKHQRDAVINRSFDMETITTEGNEIHFAQNLFSEKDIRNSVSDIRKVLKVIKKKVPVACNFRYTGFDIYVLENMSGVDIKTAAENNIVILTEDDLKQLVYKYWLLEAVSGENDGSRLYGLYGYIFDLQHDDATISNYIKADVHKEMLDLFYARADSEYVDQEDAAVFRQLLISLADYAISQDGMKQYLSQDMNADLHAWLNTEVGIKQEESERDDLSQLQYFRDENYKLHITDGQTQYLFHVDKSAISSIDQIADMIKSNRYMRKNGISYVTKQDAEVFSKSNDLEKVTYDIDYQPGIISETFGENASVAINNPNESTMIHEMTHLLIGKAVPDKYWVCEGFCEYFAYKFYPAGQTRKILYSMVSGQDRDAESVNVAEYYNAHAEKASDIAEMDPIIAMNYYTYAFLSKGNDGSAHNMYSIKLGSILGHPNANGSELSYPEAMSFVDYLVKKYSFKTVWDFMYNESDYHSTFGRSYDSLKKEWEKEIL